MKINPKNRATKNKTIILNDVEISRIDKRLIKINRQVFLTDIENKTINQDVFETFDFLPDNFADLVFVDPPCNLNKTFNLTTFKAMESAKYEEWLNSWIQKMIRLLKPNASVYICGDWKSSGTIFNNY